MSFSAIAKVASTDERTEAFVPLSYLDQKRSVDHNRLDGAWHSFHKRKLMGEVSVTKGIVRLRHRSTLGFELNASVELRRLLHDHAW
jgi:hypothetical protein